MASSPKPTLLILGGAGAQNTAIAKSLSASNLYSIRLLTRSLSSPHAQELADIPNVNLLEGDCYNEETLVSVLQGVDYCYVNTNGFAIGEKNEIYWGIRIFEIARWAGVKHFVYSSLPYVSKNGDWDPKRRVPFVDGKAKVAQYLSAQPTKPMVWSVLESGPYADRLWDAAVAKQDENGVYVFKLPLGPTGSMPLVSLEDMGRYAQWMFANPDSSAGLILGVAIKHVTGAEHASAFEAVTGHKSRYEEISIEDAVAHLPPLPRIGAKASPGYDDPTLWCAAEHFTPWWAIFRDSDGNTGCWTRNYALLDEIMPDRIRTLEEWMRSVGYDGTYKPILKTSLSLD